MIHGLLDAQRRQDRGDRALILRCVPGRSRSSSSSSPCRRSGTTTGVARSLELVLNQRPTRPRAPSANWGPRTGCSAHPGRCAGRERLSPAGTGTRISQIAGQGRQPPAWTIERIMGAKGVGLVLWDSRAGSWAVRHRGLFVAASRPSASSSRPPGLQRGVKRQDELQRGLADALDMLTVCVEAGQGFDAAILRWPALSRDLIAGEFAASLRDPDRQVPRRGLRLPRRADHGARGEDLRQCPGAG